MIVPECSSPELYLIVTIINHLKFFFSIFGAVVRLLRKKVIGFTTTNSLLPMPFVSYNYELNLWLSQLMDNVISNKKSI